MKKIFTLVLMFSALLTNAQLPLLKVSENKRFFRTSDGQPFFWLGDTAWLLFMKCNREEAVQYLDDRKNKQFNVIQVMVLHDIKAAVNAYGDSALIGKDISLPKTTPGKSFNNADEYDFWDNVDYVIGEAENRGIYVALVPVWGANVKYIDEVLAKSYASFLANRYKDASNIIWLNGGDVKGDNGFKIWNVIGNAINSIDKNHLIGFHPRGRNSSSTWFHNEPWLDFNMFQSGHKSYAQDTLSTERLHYGEDNWRYARVDYNLRPVKPTLDGEPSYEDIPYGLHEKNQPYWKDYEVRRYAYWSVFEGGCGFTYGHNAVMQFHTPGDTDASFFPKVKWQEGIHAPGAGQMQHLKKLMLGKSYFDRMPAQPLVTDNGEKYNRVLATAGKEYAMFYVYNGRSFSVAIDKLNFKVAKASWFSPKDGVQTDIKDLDYKTAMTFDPPGEIQNGADWVLILEK